MACAVTKFWGLLVDVAVIVIFAGVGGGFGAVNNPELLIVPALAVQTTGAFAVNWNVVPATSWDALEVIDSVDDPAAPTVLIVIVGVGLTDGSATGVALTTTGPPVPPGVNVIEVEGLGPLKVPSDELQVTVFGTPFVTAAVNVRGWPTRAVLRVLL